MAEHLLESQSDLVLYMVYPILFQTNTIFHVFITAQSLSRISITDIFRISDFIGFFNMVLQLQNPLGRI